MSIDPSRVKSLFLAASEIADLVKRAAFLEQQCGGDAELRRRVEMLLRANDESPLPPTGEVGATVDSQGSPPAAQDFVDSSARVGSLLAGKYKLVEEIGAGGMGSVFLAQQISPVKRAVAVKVIKAGMDSKSILARFDAERQALALMDHPNIAKVLDGGTTDVGRPFFVMELVRGLPLTQYCDERRLTLRQRLELFVPVCQAIQHAHQKGVIHRDIKPSNVLVALYDDRAVPKVIDFGVAKAAGQRLTDQTIMTGIGALIGTPEYMSPEQAQINNLDVDSRSDVYSLGVLLYELLTGTTPVDRQSLGRAALLEILRIVREVEAPRPSAKLSSLESLLSVAANRSIEPARLTRMISGELDWVLLKALEKDRTRRYETANALARDLQRYLADEMVEARPPSAAYRFRKMVRKHRVAFVFALSLATSLLIGIIVSTAMALSAMRAHESARLALESEAKHSKRAQIARDRTRQALDAMTSAVAGEALATQNTLTDEQKSFLTDVLKYYREFASETGDDEQSRARSAEAAIRVAMIESRLGRAAEAVEAFKQACSAFRNLVSEFPNNDQYSQSMLRCHSDLGLILARLRKLPEARAELQQAMLHRTDHAGKAILPADKDARIDMNLGFVAAAEGNLELTASHYEKALLLIEKALQEDAENYGNQQVYAQCLGSLGWVRQAERKLDQSVALLQKSLEVYKRILGQTPRKAEIISGMAQCHSNLGMVYNFIGDNESASEQYRQGLDAHRKLAATYPNAPEHQLACSLSQNALGLMLLEMGKWAEARSELEEALAVLLRLQSQNQLLSSVREVLYRVHGNLGRLFQETGDPTRAEIEQRNATVILGALLQEKPESLELLQDQSILLNNLGRMLESLGNLDESEATHRQALQLRLTLLAKTGGTEWTRNYLAYSHHNLGIVLARQNKYEQALEQYQLAIDIRKTLVNNDSRIPEYRLGLGGVYANQGELQLDQENIEAAVDSFTQAAEILEGLSAEQQLNSCYEYLVRVYVGRAKAYQSQQQYDDAVVEIEKGLAIELTPLPSTVRVNYALALALAGRVNEAVDQANQLIGATDYSQEQWYDLARVNALAINHSSDPQQQNKYSEEAVRLLKLAVEQGLRDADKLQKDPMLRPLQEREDFRVLLGSLRK